MSLCTLKSARCSILWRCNSFWARDHTMSQRCSMILSDTTHWEQVRFQSCTYQPFRPPDPIGTSVLLLFTGRSTRPEAGHHEKFAVRPAMVETVWCGAQQCSSSNCRDDRCHHTSLLRCGRTESPDWLDVRINHYVSAVHMRFELPRSLLVNDSSILWVLPHVSDHLRVL